MRRSSPLRVLTLLSAMLPTMGCLLRTRPVEETYSKAPLKEASQSALIDGINQQAQKIQSLQATVDIDTSVGGAKKGSRHRLQRNSRLRAGAETSHAAHDRTAPQSSALPLSTWSATDKRFKLWIPPKNRFVIGSDEAQAPNPDQPMENIRPQDISMPC